MNVFRSPSQLLHKFGESLAAHSPEERKVQRLTAAIIALLASFALLYYFLT